jgi:hypothetical protein
MTCASTRLQTDIRQTCLVNESVGRAAVNICKTSRERFYTDEIMHKVAMSLCYVFKMQCAISFLVSHCDGDVW